MKKKHFLIIGVLICSLFILSCKKVKRTFLLKGKWEIESFKINGGQEDMIAAFFANHTAGDGKMLMNFSDEGVFKAEHYSYNKIDSVIYGTWSMPEHDVAIVRMGDLADGTFQVELVDATHAILHTDSNLIRFYDIGYVTAVLELSLSQKE